MNYIDFFTEPNGFPLEADATLGFMQTDYQEAIKGLASAFAGNGVIVSGMGQSGSVVDDGWIYYDGDFIKFEGGVIAPNFYIDEVVVQKANQSGDLVDRYTTKIAKFGSGAGAVSFSSLIRLESLFSIQEKLIDGFSLEPSVVLKGCVVSAVNTGAQTLNISAGTAIINRKLVVAPAYSGGYPVYLNEIGEWENTPPANHVKFDPYTSQRLPNVIYRTSTPSGVVLMLTALSDRFDNTGLGKWEWAGFAICNGANGTLDLRSRFPVGYDARNTDPGGNLWDSAYNTPGSVGGEKAHELTIAEMPAHNHTGGSGSVAANQSGLIRRSQAGESVTMTTPDAFGSGTEPDIVASPSHIPSQGGGLPHENRPPFRTLVFIQRL